MKISKMLKYIFSLSLICNVLVSWGQQVDVTEPKIKVGGISAGINLAPFITQLFEKERIGFEANARYIFNRKWQMVAEAGFEHVDFEKEQYHYKSDGTFLRVGLDYNFFNVDELGNNDNILAGLRYGAGIQEHESPRYQVDDAYWGDFESKNGLPLSSVNSHWVELVFGLRSEVMKNFYMGWTVRLKQLLVVNTEDVLEPYTIPGYGHRDNETNLSFTYTIEYQIPFKSKN